jgi:hypothetical protein
MAVKGFRRRRLDRRRRGFRISRLACNRRVVLRRKRRRRPETLSLRRIDRTVTCPPRRGFRRMKRPLLLRGGVRCLRRAMDELLLPLFFLAAIPGRLQGFSSSDVAKGMMISFRSL